MIYLIGGPPKCGKTTLAKKLSKKAGIPWISADTLQSIVQSTTSSQDFPKKFPWSTKRKQTNRSNDLAYSTYSAQEIVKAYTDQAKASYTAVEALTSSEIINGNDYVVEGYQIEPQLVSKLVKKFGSTNVRSVFLTKQDASKFVEDIEKSKTPNDWIITRTEDEQTYRLIAEMIIEYGKYFERESKKHGFKSIQMDSSFARQLNTAAAYLISK